MKADLPCMPLPHIQCLGVLLCTFTMAAIRAVKFTV